MSSQSGDVSAKGYEESMKFIKDFNSTMDTRIISFLERVADLAVYLARNNIQQHQNIVTGTLLASIRILSRDPGGKSIKVGTDEFYAAWIEYGRGPVKPISATVLHWVDKYTGKDVFAKFAGPTNPEPFMEPAVIEATRGSKDIFIRNETEMIQELL